MSLNDPSAKIRIAQIIGRINNGGVERYVLNFLEHIDCSKVQFDLFVENESEMINSSLVEKYGGKLFIIPKYKKMLEYQKVLFNYFKNNHYDIVQANVNSLSYFPLKVAKKAGIKVRIANSLSMTNKKEGVRWIIKNILKSVSKRYATHYFANSDLAGKWLFGKNIVDNERYYKVLNAIDSSKYVFDIQKREQLKNKYHLENSFVIGTVGRLEKQKNQFFLIDIFSEILKKRPNSFLIIIGDGPLYNDLLSYLKKKGIEKQARILTSKDVGINEMIADYYSLFDSFVLPSLYEGLPTVGIEAQVSGLPCFFSETITKETSFTNSTFYLDLALSEEEWADKILEHSPLLNRQESHLIEEVDIQKQAGRLLKIYEDILREAEK